MQGKSNKSMISLFQALGQWGLSNAAGRRAGSGRERGKVVKASQPPFTLSLLTSLKVPMK